MQTIKNMENQRMLMLNRKRELMVKAQIKSDDQILYENLLQKEENLKKVLIEREETISSNEKYINDLRNKLQVYK